MQSPTFKHHYTPAISQPHITPDSIHNIYYFENGYGASVHSDYEGYFSNNTLRIVPDKYELAVLKCTVTPHPELTLENHRYWHLCYTTPVTDDVLRYITHDEVQQALDTIASL